MPKISDLRLGFVGHGAHARANLYPSIALAGGSIHSVTTRSQRSSQIAAKAVGARNAHVDLLRMLEADALDAVFVSVVPEDQAQVTEYCIRAGIPVFVEKPLGMTAEEARRIADLADAQSSQVMVGFMKRFAPVYRTLTELISDRDRFGRTMVVDATFCFTPWDPNLRDDTYLKLGAIHIVDLLLALFGDVEAASGHRSSKGIDIGMAFSLQFKNDTVATLSLCGVPAWAREYERITVSGTKGWAEVTDLKEVRYHHMGQSKYGSERWHTLDEETVHLTAVNSPLSGGSRDLYQRGFAGEIAHFLDSVANETEPKPSARDNAATMALCDRLIEAIS